MLGSPERVIFRRKGFLLARPAYFDFFLKIRSVQDRTGRAVGLEMKGGEKSGPLQKAQRPLKESARVIETP